MLLPPLLAALLTAFGTANAQCDLFWQYFEPTNSCFRLFNQGGNFYESDAFCHTQDAHLPILTTIEETQYAENLLIDVVSNRPIEESSFVGLTASDGTCNWEWLDGTPLKSSVVQFMSNQGNMCGHGEYCSFIMSPNYQLYANKILGDHTCYWRVKRTLCKKAAKPKSPVVPPVCDNGWTLHNETKSCFKIFNRPANWNQAKAHCASFGGYLAKITTLGETSLIKKMVQQHPINVVQDMPLIGLSAPKGDCDFRWLDGTRLDTNAIAFTNIHNNPDNCRTTQRCGKVYVPQHWSEPKYILDDIQCGTIHNRVLCKKAAVMPIEEKIECKSGWTRLTGTNTCVKESEPKKTTHQQGTILESKCITLPLRSHFDKSTEICYVRADDCTSVPLPAPLLSLEDIWGYDVVRSTLERKRIANTTSICAFGYNNYCGNGNMRRGEHCFWLTKKAGSWSAVSNDCQKEGGTLFVPHSDRHIQNALAFFADQNVPSAGVYWLGLFTTDSMKSVDGSEVDYLRWIPPTNELEMDGAHAMVILDGTFESPDYKGSSSGYMRLDKLINKNRGLCSRKAPDDYTPAVLI